MTSMKSSSVKTSLVNSDNKTERFPDEKLHENSLHNLENLLCLPLRSDGKVIKVSDPLYLVINTKYKWETTNAYDHG